MKKINTLFHSWEKNHIKLNQTLKAAGISDSLLSNYVKHKWLKSIGYGAYKLYADDITWESGINAIQEQMQANIHPGGKYALIEHGFSHFIYPKSKVYLYRNSQEKLPAWFKSRQWDSELVNISTNIFNYQDNEKYTIRLIKNINIKISVPELAIMEFIFLVPKVHSFNEASLIMEGMFSLRSSFVQQLLEECTSVKVKRIFLYLAEKYNHFWFKELNLDKIYLGRGERIIEENGKWDAKYLITVPKNNEE
jgi:hypothetical protein